MEPLFLSYYVGSLLTLDALLQGVAMSQNLSCQCLMQLAKAVAIHAQPAYLW
jgi:hypothetical protein